jgi:hypothetical protein
MRRFFKKRQPMTLMDAFIKITYGSNYRTEGADLSDACRIAHRELLLEKIEESEVVQQARYFFEGPIPYSTYDIAVSVALHFFRKPELINQLRDVQLLARKKVSDWLTEGEVNALLARSFENVLYNLYKPYSPITGDTESLRLI